MITPTNIVINMSRNIDLKNIRMDSKVINEVNTETKTSNISKI